MEMLGERVSDRRVLKLMRKWLEAGVMEERTVRETLAGTPQGGVISPLLANIYLSKLDGYWDRECGQLGVLVRYADDFVVMCRTEAQAKEAQKRVTEVLAQLGLTLHPDKTRLADLSRGKAGFVFLGCVNRKRRSVRGNPRRHYMQRWPSPKALTGIRQRVHELTDVRGNRAKGVKEAIEALNPVLRGWGNYFRSGNSDREFHKVDRYVRARLTRWLWRRGGQRPQHRHDLWPPERLHRLGLHRLQGTVVYLSNATSERPSVSRVRENRTHGLKGGIGTGLN